MHIIRGDLKNYTLQIISYFAPAYSRFISLGESLPDDIIRFATMGDIVLIGDFNAQTKDEQKLC